MSNISGFVKRIRDIMRNDAGINGDAQRIEQIAWMLFLKVYDAKEDDWEFNEDDYTSIIPEECRWRNWAHDESGKGMTGDALLNFVNNTVFPTLKKLEVTPQTPIRKAIVQTTFADANQYMKDGVLLRQVLNVIDDLNLNDYEESHPYYLVSNSNPICMSHLNCKMQQSYYAESGSINTNMLFAHTATTQIVWYQK